MPADSRLRQAEAPVHASACSRTLGVSDPPAAAAGGAGVEAIGLVVWRGARRRGVGLPSVVSGANQVQHRFTHLYRPGDAPRLSRDTLLFPGSPGRAPPTPPGRERKSPPRICPTAALRLVAPSLFCNDSHPREPRGVSQPRALPREVLLHLTARRPITSRAECL